MLFRIITGVLAGLGLYLILADCLHLPHWATIKATRAVAHASKVSGLDRMLGRLSQRLSKHIRLNPFARAQLAGDLVSAGESITPEQYKANAIVKALVVGVLAIPAWLVSPLISLLVLVLAVYAYRSNMGLVNRQLKQRRSNLEYELPRLVYTVEKHLKHSRDVLSMLESYSAHAGPELQQELRITTADMRSGNYEAALTRLEARVGSAQMSDVCRGLISTLRGDDTAMYWASLGIKFDDYQRQRLRLQAQQMPKRVKWLSMSLLICFMMVYIVVILFQIMDSLGVLFG